MPSPIRHLAAPAFAALALLITVAPVRAFEDGENPWHGTAPDQPFYAPDQRLVLADPEDGSVLFRSPSRITIQFRRFDFDLNPSSLALWVDGVEHTRDLKFWTDVAWYDLPPAASLGEGEHEILASIQDHAGLSYSSSAIINVLFPPCPGGCPWPFAPTSEPNPVANLMEDWQDFIVYTPYFHGGLDIRADAGTPVHACVAGTVVNVDNYGAKGPLKWEVAVQDAQGYIWQYHHLDINTVTVSKGDPVAQGQVLGDVVAWTTDVHGYEYDHVHLNVTRWYGPGTFTEPYTDGWVHYNPLGFLTAGSYKDLIAPSMFDVYFAPNENNTPFADSNSGTATIIGNVDVIAHLHDYRTTVPPPNGQPYELSPYELAYSIVPVNTPCGMGFLPRTRLVRYDAMPGGKIVATQTKVLETLYKQTVNYTGVTGTHYNYSDQQYFYTLTNVHNGYPDGPNGSWNSAQTGGLGPIYPDGKYTVKIYSDDYDGNETVTPVSVQVSNGQTYTGVCPPYIIDWGWLHPLTLMSPSGNGYGALPPPAAVSFGPVVDGSAHATLDSSSWPVWIFDLPDRGMRIAIGLLAGHLAQLECVPLLGDVIVDADAEAQVLPPGGVFDPSRPVSNPVPLHLTTRLVRDPATGAALIGRAADYGGSTFTLVLNATVPVPGGAMTLSAGTGAGDNAHWDLAPVGVGRDPLPAVPTAVSVRAVPNPIHAGGAVHVSLDRPRVVSVEILDAAGRRVRLLTHGLVAAGDHAFVWDGRDFEGRRPPAGVYLVNVRGDGIATRAKLVLLE